MESTDRKDITFINSEVSLKFNIVRYGLIGHQVHSDSGKVLFVANNPDNSTIAGATDYSNWLLALRWAQENYELVKQGHESKQKQLTLF